MRKITSAAFAVQPAILPLLHSCRLGLHEARRFFLRRSRKQRDTSCHRRIQWCRQVLWGVLIGAALAVGTSFAQFVLVCRYRSLQAPCCVGHNSSR